MDLAALGERMAARKMEIMEEMPMDVPPGRGGRRAGLQERAPSGRHR